MRGALFCLVLSPVPGEYIGWHVTGGCAALTPGYHRLTRSGLIKWSRASARLGIIQNPAGILIETPTGWYDNSRGWAKRNPRKDDNIYPHREPVTELIFVCQPFRLLKWIPAGFCLHHLFPCYQSLTCYFLFFDGFDGGFFLNFDLKNIILRPFCVWV